VGLLKRAVKTRNIFVYHVVVVSGAWQASGERSPPIFCSINDITGNPYIKL